MSAPDRDASDADGPRVAVVLSGAAARGAFQAGALAELVPALEREGLRPTVWLGTSAGSIDAVLWGSFAHLGTQAASQRVVDVWERMSDDDVFSPLLPLSLPRTGLQYAAGAVLGRGPGTTSLLDTGPLRRTADDELRSEQLATNLADGVLKAVGVVATRMPPQSEHTLAGTASGRSVLFLDEHRPGTYAGDPARALDVARGRLRPEHVLASSAIPVAFPPVEVHEPVDAAGWYVDGGVRLNAPLHPAVGLGATHVVLVSATSTTYGPRPGPDLSGQTPDIADAAAQVMNAALADRTTEDLRTLRRTNRLVEQSARGGDDGVLTSSLGDPYRLVEVMAVSPPPDEMGRVATRIFHEKTDGLGRVRELDNYLLGQLLRGAGDGSGRRELLSYLFFDEDYFAAGVEIGRRAATEALAAGWQR